MKIYLRLQACLMRLKKDTYIKLRAKSNIKEFYTLFKRLLSSSTSYIIYPPPPPWNSPCRSEGAYPLRRSNQSASTKGAQLNVAAKVVRPTDLLNNVKT